MRAPLSWIREFTPLDADPATVADALDNLGLEVEAVDALGEEILDVTAAKVLEVAKHPNADKLSLVEIETGAGTTIGRLRCAERGGRDDRAVRAARGRRCRAASSWSGARSVVSCPTGCSAPPKELGLGDDHSGILGLPEDTELGADVRDVLELHDVVFDLSITPNRPDAMSIVGVARDLAAHFGLPLLVPEPQIETTGAPTGDDVSVVVEAPERCPRFTVRRIEVTMGESPAWLARRLTLAGMRPISNVVDVTNYVLLERGQPLHAFDLGRLRGPRARGAARRRRREDDDARRRRAHAHRRGPPRLRCRAPAAGDRRDHGRGRGRGARRDHRDPARSCVLPGHGDLPVVEAARAPLRVERALRARHRPERRAHRVDPGGRAAARGRVGATVAPDPIDEYPAPVAPARITVRVPRVEALLGVELDPDHVKNVLRPLEIEIDPTNDPLTFIAVAPTFRPDLEREIDIVEEVARRIGFNQIPRTLPHTTGVGGGLTPRQRDRRVIEDVLVGTGASEAMTVPLIAVARPRAVRPERRRDRRGDERAAGRGADPPAADPARAPEGRGVTTRPRVSSDLALFELGHVFAAPVGGNVLPDERDHLAVLLTGVVARGPVEPDRPVDEYDAVDALRALGEALELADLRLERDADRPGLRPGPHRRDPRRRPRHRSRRRARRPPSWTPSRCPGPRSRSRWTSTGCSAGPGATGRSRPCRGSRRRASTSRSSCPNPCWPRTVEATLRRAGGDLLESVRCFDEFRSRRARARPAQPRVRAALPRAGPHLDRRRDRQGCASGRSTRSSRSHGAELRGR